MLNLKELNHKVTCMHLCASGAGRGFLDKVTLKLALEGNNRPKLSGSKQKGIPGGGDCMKLL